VERLSFEKEKPMPTQFDMTQFLDLLHPSEDDRATLVFVRAFVVMWAVAMIILWGVS
jgi:hypothetical protein